MDVYRAEIKAFSEAKISEYYPAATLPEKSTTANSNLDEQDEWTSGDPIDVRCTHRQEIRPTFWESLSLKKLLMNSGTPNKYTMPGKYHSLYGSHLDMVINGVEVLPEYRDTIRIRWPRYMGFEVAGSSSIPGSNGISIYTMTPQAMEASHAFHRANDFTATLEVNAGRSTDMNKWTSRKLPSKTLSCPLYFPYSNKGSCIPLHKWSGFDVVHNFVPSLEIKNHLRMQQFDGEKWVSILPDLSKVRIDSNVTDFKIPELQGLFSYKTDHELSYDKLDESVVGDCTTIIESDIKSYGGSWSIKIPTDGNCCKLLVGSVENMTSRTYGDYFNFTDNVHDPEKGESPISEVSATYGGNKVKLFTANMSTFGAIAQSHVSSWETNKGHILIPFDIESSKLNILSSGTNLTSEDFKLAVKLRDIRPGEETCQYRLVVVAYTFKQIGCADPKSQGVYCL